MEAKKVKLTVPQLEEAFGAMQGLDNPNLTYAASYWIGRNMKSIREEAKEINELKQKLLQDHALMVDGKTVQGDSPGSIKLNPEKAPEYWKHLEEISKQEIEVRVWPISLSLLRDKNGKPIEVKPSVFMMLDFLFTEDEAFEVSCMEFLEKAGYEVFKKGTLNKEVNH